MKKSTKNRIEFTLFQFFLKIFRPIKYKIVEKIIEKLFVFGGRVLRIRRDVALANLRSVYRNNPNIDPDELCDKVYHFMGKTVAEIYFGNDEKLIKNTQVIGWEYLQDAVSMGRGVILASAHSGNWELAGKYISKSYDFAVIYKKQRNTLFDDYMNSLREKDGIGVILNKPGSLRTIFKLLKKNYLITILMDQHAGRRGILTKFLGLPASTYPGSAKIAQKSNSPIVPAVAVRNKNGDNLFIIQEAILPQNYEKSEVGIKKMTEDISQKIENIIYKYPEQWFWVHKRWKNAGLAKVIRDENA